MLCRYTSSSLCLLNLYLFGKMKHNHQSLLTSSTCRHIFEGLTEEREAYKNKDLPQIVIFNYLEIQTVFDYRNYL